MPDIPTDREGLVAYARQAILNGDVALYRDFYGTAHESNVQRSAIARAHYARASVLIQLAGYLGMTEEQHRQSARWESMHLTAEGLAPGFDPAVLERQRQDDFIAGRDLEARMNREDGR